MSTLDQVFAPGVPRAIGFALLAILTICISWGACSLLDKLRTKVIAQFNDYQRGYEAALESIMATQDQEELLDCIDRWRRHTDLARAVDRYDAFDRGVDDVIQVFEYNQWYASPSSETPQ